VNRRQWIALQWTKQGRWKSWFASIRASFARLQRRFSLYCTPTHSRRRQHTFAPTFDCLEPRLTPSTWTLQNANSSGTGSLSAAVASANSDTSNATIDFNPSVFTSATTIKPSALLTLSNTSHSITIDGSGAGPITISGNNSHQVFKVNSGVTATIENLTISAGWIAGSGGINNGAGINNAGTLTLSDCVISGNTCGQTASYYFYSTNDSVGAGVYNTGTMSVTGSTISSNYCYSNRVSDGGGVYNDGTMTITGSTIAGNSVKNGYRYGHPAGGECTIGKAVLR
jgi:hypothetical protein